MFGGDRGVSILDDYIYVFISVSGVPGLDEKYYDWWQTFVRGYQFSLPSGFLLL